MFLAVAAARRPAGAELTGQFFLQPAAKALMALLLAVAATGHPIIRERRWLVGALVFSAAGDFLLAMPGWTPSFVLGLAAFLLAHVCFLAALAALAPLAALSRRPGADRPGPAPRLAAVPAIVLACTALLVWLWPRLVSQAMAVPVTAYIAVLCAMVCAAAMAQLPTPWTALGALCFAVSDAMIGIGRFVLGSGALAVPIWWTYALAQILITAGFFFGRATGPAGPEQTGSSVPSAKPSV